MVDSVTARALVGGKVKFHATSSSSSSSKQVESEPLAESPPPSEPCSVDFCGFARLHRVSGVASALD
eukprot:3425878-Rhodomonas_salina.1